MSLFPHGQTNAMHAEFMGFGMDDDTVLHLRNWAERQGYPATTVMQGGPDMFASLLENASAPRLTIIDIDGHADPVGAVTRLLHLCGGACRLVMTGSTNDVTLYRRMQMAGAVDYLVKPLTLESLNLAMAASLRGPVQMGKPLAREARLIAFIGTRGGVGTSTIALNAGWLMAHELHRTVALFDLDLQFGTSALALDLEPGRGLRDIVSSPNRVDSLMISSSLVAESENFSVLGAEESVDEVVPVDSSAIAALLKEMKGNFDIILVDLPRHMLAAHKRSLMAAHEIVLVSDMTLAGIRDTLRIKTALNSLGITARVTVIAARTGASGAGHIDRAVFEKGIQGKVDIVIPEDSAAFTAAANSGKALAAASPRAGGVRILRDLAVRLSDLSEAEWHEKPGFFGKWMKELGLGGGKGGRKK